MSRHRGDDLDDDYVPDELVASSGEEDIGANNDIQGLLSADEDDEHEERRQTATLAKRKRREKDKERKEKVGRMPQCHASSDLPVAQRRKLTETKDVSEPPSIAMQSPQQLAYFLSSVQARAFPDKSSLELLDLGIPGESPGLDPRLVDFNSTVR